MENLEDFPNSLRYFEKLYNISKKAMKKYSLFGKEIVFNGKKEGNFICICKSNIPDDLILLQTIIKEDSNFKQFLLIKSRKSDFDDYSPQEKEPLNIAEKINRLFNGEMRPHKLTSLSEKGKPIFKYNYLSGNYLKI